MPTDTDVAPLNRAARRHQAHVERRGGDHSSAQFRAQREVERAWDAPPVLPQPERLLRRGEVLSRVGGVQPSTLWRWIQTGQFPQPVRLNSNGHLLAWRETEITAWIDSRECGDGHMPREALAERARRIVLREREAERRRQNIAAGRTPIFGFRRMN
jgi:prophage regulatory protein